MISIWNVLLSQTIWYGLSLVDLKKKKKKNRIIQTPPHSSSLHCWAYCYNVSLQKPTNRQKLHGQWKTAWVLPFKLWINYNTVALFEKKKKIQKTRKKQKQKKNKKKKPLLSSAPRLPIQKLLWDVSSAGFPKSTLALTSSLRWRWVSEAVPSHRVWIFRLCFARLRTRARTSRASLWNFISNLALERSFKWRFGHSYLSLGCSDTVVLWEHCPSRPSRAGAARPSSVRFWF